MDLSMQTSKVRNSREFSQNLMHHLWDRESGFNRRNFRNVPQFFYERQFYKSITPCLTIQNVDKPLGFIRKFTPDGQYLLCFSHDQHSVHIYKYNGVGSVIGALQQHESECITAADKSLHSLWVRQNIFHLLFSLYCVIRPNVTHIHRFSFNREFSIFLDNGRYVLLAGITNSTDIYTFSNIRSFPDTNDSCEVCMYEFVLIDLKYNFVTDILKFDVDFITLAHNQGVSVCGNTIAILSKFRQCIEIVEMVDDGKLERLFTIGATAQDIEERVYDFDIEPFLTEDDLGVRPLPHMKQLILSFLYRQIYQIEDLTIRRRKLHDFYKYYTLYENMLIAKIQLIDKDHLLIRYEKRQNYHMSLGYIDGRKDIKLYVFYEITTQKILQIHSEQSVCLLNMLRNYCDSFRNVRSLQTQRPPSSPNNNIYFRADFDNAVKSIQGGQLEAAIHFNPTLPISTQGFATSPLLDYSLFKFDDRLISLQERPKYVNFQSVEFIDRETNIVKFRLCLEKSNNIMISGDGNRELVVYIFHPFEPLVISLQKLTRRFVINIHIYNTSTIVAQNKT